MSWRRISGLIMQDLYMTRRESTLWADLFFFSIINVLVFGLIAKHFAGSDAEAGLFVVSGMLLWEIIRLCQYTVTVTSLWNVWSSNLSNLFIAPISLVEYAVGNILSATIKTIAILIPLSIATWLCFDFSILSIGMGPLILAVVNLVVFSASLGLILLGLIFRYGTRVQALAWSAVYLFQPLLGVYFPLDVLPRPFELIAQVIPATHTFQGVRNAILGTGDVYGPLLLSGAVGLVILVACYFAFAAWHRRSMVVGQFARNNG